MREIAKKELEQLVQRRPELQVCSEALAQATERLAEVYRRGRKENRRAEMYLDF